MPTDQINMVKSVISYHLEDEDPLGLRVNKQGSYGRENYENEVLPRIIESFFNQHKHLSSYREYITGKNKELPTVDSQTLRAQIETAKEVFKVLPNAMEKSARQKYDRIPGGEKVVPYLSAGNPMSREFGSTVEAAIYQFLTILAKGAEVDCLTKIAIRMKKKG